MCYMELNNKYTAILVISSVLNEGGITDDKNVTLMDMVFYLSSGTQQQTYVTKFLLKHAGKVQHSYNSQAEKHGQDEKLT